MNESGRGERHMSLPQEITLDETRYATIADDLLTKYGSEVRLPRPMSEEGSIRMVLRQFSDSILEKYWGHGVDRGDKKTQIAAALSILENRIMFGDASRIRNSGMVDAYTGGSLLVISRKDGPSLIQGLKEGDLQRVRATMSDGEKQVGLRIDPGAFVFNKGFDVLVEPLREMYPDANIIYAAELPNYIQEQEGQTL